MIGRDVRYAFRVLLASPLFSITAVICLTLGIGANTAIFTLIDRVVLRPLPVRAPHELVLVTEVSESRQSFSLTSVDFETMRHSTALSGLCAFRPWAGFRVSTQAGSRLVPGQLASSNCFDLLGVPAFMGRMLLEADDRPNAPPVVVIGYDFWQQFLQGDRSAVGRTLTLSGRPFTIVGVTPRGFFGLEAGRTIGVTVPLSAQPVVMPGTPLATMPGARWLRLMGRTAPGISADAAQADLQRLRKSAPAAPRTSVQLVSGAQGINDLRRQFALPLRMLMIGVGLLLALSCANLAGLMLARAGAREREIGVRLALGAGRGRVFRQLLTEALMLSALGGLAGVIFAFWSTHAMVALISRGRLAPIVLDLEPDPRLFAFTAIVSILTAITFGAWPAIRATRDAAPEHVLTGNRTVPGRARRTGFVIALQGALSLVLLVAAGLFVRTLVNLRDADLGYQKGTVILASVRPAVSGIPDDRVEALYAALYDAFGRLPGVDSVTASMDTPVSGLSWSAGITVAGRPREAGDPPVFFNFVGPRFLETMGIRLIAGRDIGSGDTATAIPVAVISESVARHYFGATNPIGQQLHIQNALVEVVGVASDVHFRSPRQEGEPIVYRPYLQQLREPAAIEELTFALRTTLPEETILEGVRREVRRIAPDLPLYTTSTLDAQFDASVATERMLATIATFFGGLGLLIVMTGTYGTLAYAAGQRTKELGIRAALGAARRDLAALLLKSALLPLILGLAAGLPLAFAVTRLARSTLFGVAPSDPLTYFASLAVLLIAGAAAAFLPARRAARTDPMVALRQQ